MCDLCIMQCSWKCPHYDCTLLCHEICDRPRCAFPCPKKLQCKHECLGFCGEPCPPCCLLCDSKTLQAYAEERNVRLVYLPDCKHFFEFSFLDNVIKEMAPNESLMFLFCPKCKTNISWHPRYNKIIKLQRKRRNLAKAITVYVSEAKGWEYFPLFFPSFLHCQKLIENCVSLLINNMDDPHKDSLIETCDKALTQINSIRTMLRPSFEQYSSVYDAIRKISEDWPMDSKENNSLKTNISDLVENFTKHIGNEIIKRTTENNQVTTNGSIKSPTIFLIADPHAEHWKICKQGHVYCCIFKFGECVICEGPKEKVRYSKKLREYLNHASSIDLIADCKIPRRKTEGAEGYETNTFQTKLKKYECCNEKQNEVNSDNKAENDVMRKTKDKLLPRWKKPKRPKWWEEKL